jgi:hypothetical protein
MQPVAVVAEPALLQEESTAELDWRLVSAVQQPFMVVVVVVVAEIPIVFLKE